MKKSFYVKYVGEEKSNVVTFDGVKVDVEKWDVVECSEKNARNVCKMYPKIFKRTEKEVKERKGRDKAKKTVEKKKVEKKSIKKETKDLPKK